MASKPEIDEELVDGLKAAKSKRCYFALVMKGGTDGALVVDKQKIPPARIAAAKKKSGGSALLQGVCFVEDGRFIFELDKVPPATMVPAIKTIVKRDAEMTVNVVCRLGTSAELKTLQADATAKSATLSAEPQSAPENAGGKPIFSFADFKKSCAGWDAAKAKIHKDMKKLDDTIRAEITDDPDLGRELVEYIDDMLVGLDKNLQSALDALVRAGTDADRQSAKAGALGVIDRYQKTVAINPGVKQIEKNPVMPISILTPLNGTLEIIKRYIAA